MPEVAIPEGFLRRSFDFSGHGQKAGVRLFGGRNDLIGWQLKS